MNVCPDHPRYRVLRPPRSHCPMCWQIWRERPSLDERTEQLVQFLLAHALGLANRTTNARVSAALKLPDRGMAGRTGFMNSRMITDLVVRAREQGHPICTTPGYFYACTQEEIQATLEHERACCQRYHLRARLLEQAARDLPGATHATPTEPGLSEQRLDHDPSTPGAGDCRPTGA